MILAFKIDLLHGLQNIFEVNVASYPTRNQNYYPYIAFGDQNKIVYSMRFVTRRGILLLLPGLYVTNHSTLISVYDLS